MAGTKFVYVTYIRSTPDKVWKALTQPEFTRQYWCETWQDCTWMKGASWRIMAPNGRIADSGEILEIEPLRRIVLSWQNQLFRDMQDEGYSRLTYELEPISDAVKLTLTHFVDRPDSKLIEGTSSGWPMILSSLKSLLETGEPLEVTRKWPKEI